MAPDPFFPAAPLGAPPALVGSLRLRPGLRQRPGLRLRQGLRLSMLMAFVAAGLALSACRPHPGVPRVQALTITATEFRFDAPSTVRAGTVTLAARNAGRLSHEFALVRVGATAVPQVIDDFNRAKAGGPIPAYLGAAGGVPKLASGRTDTVHLSLTPGRYLFVCSLTDTDSTPEAAAADTAAGPQHDTLGMARELLVTASGPGRAAHLPPTEASITASDDTFDLRGLHAGRNQVTFANAGPVQAHNLVVLEFPGLSTEADVAKNWQKLVDAGAASPPIGTVVPRAVGGAEPLDPGGRSVFSVTLTAGRTYGFACFLSDRTGGPPHALARGMFVARAIR